MIVTALRRAFALLLLGALAWGVARYPANRALLAAGLGAYAALLWSRPALWLLVVPALLPVFDLTPWSGWFFFEELDLALLLTVAFGYWRGPAARRVPPLPLSAPFRLALLLVGASAALAAWIGVRPLAPLDANAFANYLSPYNSLRVAKGFAWAFLLLPMMRRDAGVDHNLQRYFVPGMLLGLAGASLAVVWERALFPGLLNFSSDYRPTAPFSAMHTGGAALDAYLSMAFPFVACWLLAARSNRQLALALLLVVLGGYAGLTTFSRGVYLAYACSAALICAQLILRRRRQGRLDWGRTLLGGAAALAAAALSQQVFGSGGYRGLLAGLGLLGAGALLAASPRRALSLPGLGLLAPLLLAAEVALYHYLRQNAAAGTDKGAYLAYALCAGLFALGALLARRGAATRGGVAGLTLAAAAFPGLALAAALVADHWGGTAADGDILPLIAFALALPLLRWRRARPLWTLSRHSVAAGLCGVIGLAIVIPLVGSYYLGSRFATTSGDFEIRLAHWREAVTMMAGDGFTQAFGMGLGRYPETYLWNNHHGERPPTYRYATEDGRAFLQLSPPHYQAGYGEVLRMLQHVDVRDGGVYRLSLDVRRRDNATALSLAICERWLLYRQSCTAAPLTLLPADGGWHHYAVTLSTALGQRAWPLRAPTQLEISAAGGNAVLDVANLSLTELASGRELLSNGAFAQGNNRWFFSSDHSHFPWHIKNFGVNLLFEMGWAGVAAMTLLLLTLVGQLLRRSLRGELSAGIYLASLAGVMAVGLFDSIFDVPRLTLLFFLILFAAALRPRAPAPSRPVAGSRSASRSGTQSGAQSGTRSGTQGRPRTSARSGTAAGTGTTAGADSAAATGTAAMTAP